MIREQSEIPPTQSDWRLLLRAFLVWLLIIAVETVHGILRAVLLLPLVGDFPARQIGVVTGSLLILWVAWLSILWLAARTRRELLGVGLLWVALTILFEITLGRLILDLPWRRLFEDYDLTQGGLLGFGMLFLFLSPLLAARLRNLGHEE